MCMRCHAVYASSQARQSLRAIVIPRRCPTSNFPKLAYLAKGLSDTLHNCVLPSCCCHLQCRMGAYVTAVSKACTRLVHAACMPCRTAHMRCLMLQELK